MHKRRILYFALVLFGLFLLVSSFALVLHAAPNSIWALVGSPGFSQGQLTYTSLKIYDGTPYVAFGDRDLGGKVTVMKFDDTNWVNVGNPGFSSAYTLEGKLAIDNGTPYVAYQDGSKSNKATVMKFDGTNWVSVGKPGFSGGAIENPSLEVYQGTPYLAYADQADYGVLSVKKFDGTNWVDVGSPSIPRERIRYPSLVIDNGTPYVAFESLVSRGKIRVMKFDGTNWVNVGKPGFATVSSTRPSTPLAMYEGRPYVAFTQSSLGKLTVIKFDGTNWVNVGNAGFSAGLVREPSLAIENGLVYVAYMDGSQPTVMRFNLNLVGAKWVPVGIWHFPQVSGGLPSMALSYYTPYVAYADYTKEGRATVVVLRGSDRVTGLRAKFNKQGHAALKWQTTDESDIAGFTVYRRGGKNDWHPTKQGFVPAKNSGESSNNKYRYGIKRIKAGKTYRFKLQVQYRNNQTEWSEVVKLGK